MAELTTPAHDEREGAGPLEAPTPAPPRSPGDDPRRADARYNVVKPVVAIPVLPSGLLDWDRHVEGFSWDVSFGGIGLQLDVEAGQFLVKDVLVALDDGTNWCYAGVQVRYAQPTEISRLRVGGRFAGQAHKILTPTNLVPSLDRKTMQFDFPVDRRILESWAQLGILQPTLIDRVEVCPRCGGVPTFRLGCPSCGSVWLEQEELIHHYACAHVAPVADFERRGELVCPKCRTRSLVVGADFEYLHGTFRCLSCHHRDSERQRIGECLRCGHRFAADQVTSHDLIGYHTSLLDPLSLLSEG
jgi:hypothetical protein